MAYIDDSQFNLDCVGLILDTDYEVETFSDPFVFLENYPESNYVTILVDIHMPKMDGFALYEKIISSSHYNGCPLFFISSDDTDSVRIKSFSLGAVDFFNRLIPSDEILTRIKTKLTFSQKHRNIIEFGDLKLDLTLLKARLSEEELKLTFIEFKLLCHFVKGFPAYSTKEELVDKVWGFELVMDATIYTHIFNLNAKLANWDYEINSERNKGILLIRKAAKR